MFIIDCLSSSESLFLGSGLATVILKSADLFHHLESALVDKLKILFKDSIIVITSKESNLTQ